MTKPHFSLKSAQQIRDETNRLIGNHKESVRDWLEARKHEELVDLGEESTHSLKASDSDSVTVAIYEPK